MQSQSHFSKMASSGLVVEHRRPGSAVSIDLALHMSQRRSQGTIAVVTDRPQALMGSVRKQWLKLIRHVQREKSSTLNRQRKGDLDEAIRHMQSIRFTARNDADEPLAYVSFATAERFIVAPPVCATLYIIEPVTKLEQHMLASWMRPGCRVVIYDK